MCDNSLNVHYNDDGDCSENRSDSRDSELRDSRIFASGEISKQRVGIYRNA